MFSKLVLKANAKINLFLKVKGLDGRGFHVLETLTASVGLCDFVEIAAASGVKVAMSVPIDGKNNAEAAAQDLVSKYGLKGADIYIKKNIPIASGLGGSSADTAAVIYGLKKIYGFENGDYSVYGDDVPFMLKGGIGGIYEARCGGEPSKPKGGIGGVAEAYAEKLSESLRAYGILIVKPSGGMLTKDIFEIYDRIKDGLPDNPARLDALAGALIKGDKRAAADNMYNELYYAALKADPDIETVRRDILRAGAFGAVMTGSGNAFVGLFGGRQGAEAAEAELKGRYHDVIVCGYADRGIEEVL
ncbi:MAG: hypothetical protein LBT30_07905 [Clostridiales bacterium]|nr:hypothetical protein [Clostridiales bacterium]